MAKPTIVHCLRLDGWAGTESILWNYIAETKELFNHVIISTSSIGEISKEKFKDVEVHELTNKYPDSPMNLIADEAEKKITELHPNLVVSWMRHCHYICGENISGTTPVVWTEHDPAIREEMSERSKALFDDNAAISQTAPSSIIFDSEPIMEMHGTAGYNNNILHVINPGIDIHKFKPNHKSRETTRAIWKERHGIGEHDCVVGFVGRNYPVKDPTYFIKIAAELHKKEEEAAVTPKTHFVMCGNITSDDKAELANFITQYGCSEFVHLLGQQDDMPSFYNAIDIYASTAKREGLSLAAIEAAACGKPFVGTNTGDVLKLVENDGKIIPIRPIETDIDQFDVTPAVDALLETKRQISTQDGLKDIGKRMRKHSTGFSTKKMSMEYSKLFERAMSVAQHHSLPILLEEPSLTP